MTVKTAQCGGIEIDETLENMNGVLGLASSFKFETMPNQEDSVQVTNPTVAEFNALLTKLKNAGLMIGDEV